MCVASICWAAPSAAETAKTADTVESDGVEAAVHVGYAFRGLVADDQHHGAALAITVDAPPMLGNWSGRLGLDLLAFAPTAQASPRLQPLLSPVLTWRLVEGPQTVTAAFGPVLGVEVGGARIDAAFGAKLVLHTRFPVVDGVAVVAGVGALVLVGNGLTGTANVGISFDPQAMWARARRGEDTTDIAVEVAPALAPLVHDAQSPVLPAKTDAS